MYPERESNPHDCNNHQIIMLIISNVLSTLATVFEYGARIVQAVIIIENIPQNTVISVAIVSIIIY